MLILNRIYISIIYYYYFLIQTFISIDILEFKWFISITQGCIVESGWVNIVLLYENKDSLWKIHYLHIYDEKNPKKEDLLFIHGVGSSAALALSSSASQLIDEYNIYAIDIPGFGRSKAPFDIALNDPDIIISYYTLCISKFIKSINVSKVRI
jgi:hypothetical protein